MARDTCPDDGQELNLIYQSWIGAARCRCGPDYDSSCGGCSCSQPCQLCHVVASFAQRHSAIRVTCNTACIDDATQRDLLIFHNMPAMNKELDVAVVPATEILELLCFAQFL